MFFSAKTQLKTANTSPFLTAFGGTQLGVIIFWSNAEKIIESVSIAGGKAHSFPLQQIGRHEILILIRGGAKEVGKRVTTADQ